MRRNRIIPAAAAALLVINFLSASAEDLQFIQRPTKTVTQKKSITNELADLPYKTLGEFQGFVEIMRNTIDQITSVKIVNRRWRHFHYSAEVSDQYNVVVPELTEDLKALVVKYERRGVNVTGKYREFKGEKWLTLDKIGLFSTVSNIDTGGDWHGDEKTLFTAAPDTVKESIVGTLRLTRKGTTISAAKLVLAPSTNQPKATVEYIIDTDKMEAGLRQSMVKLENQDVSAFGTVKDNKGQKSMTLERVIKYTPKK